MADAGQSLAFGPLLRELRLEAGLTQAALAERAGLSVRAVQHLERSLGQPQRETARRLVTALRLVGRAAGAVRGGGGSGATGPGDASGSASGRRRARAGRAGAGPDRHPRPLVRSRSPLPKSPVASASA